MATAGIHAPIKDSHSRSIRAGGFVDDAPIIFRDITHQAGLDTFHHRSGSAEKSAARVASSSASACIIEAPGSGVAVLDYDNDGWLDVYLLNASTAPLSRAPNPRPAPCSSTTITTATFTDVTDKAGRGLTLAV